MSLLLGLFAAVVMLGFPVPTPAPRLPEVHGPLMVFGAVGTLVSLERAVALRRVWALAAPVLAGLGGLALAVYGPAPVGQFLVTAGGAGLVAVYWALSARAVTPALIVQAAGAFAWFVAAVLWTGGFTVPETLPWLTAFVVLTIAGERMELAHVGASSTLADVPLTAASGALVLASTAAILWPEAGARLVGLTLVGLVWALLRTDVVTSTVRTHGLPRYAAVGLLLGYGWLVLGGLLWLAAGAVVDGPAYDALVHAVFLGFTMSMIFVHAPIILPAVLRRPLPYHPVLYGPLALMHASLLVRVTLGDAAGLTWAWRWGGLLSVVSILAFLVTSVVLARRAR
jgi:hypothetical protein